MKITEQPLALKIIYSYVLTLLFSFLSIPLFSRFYDLVFNPPLFRYGVFYDRGHELTIGGFLFAYVLFLSLFVNLFLPKNRIIAWLFGAVIPFIFFIDDGKEMLYFAIFTIIGAVLGYLIKFTYKKFKK